MNLQPETIDGLEAIRIFWQSAGEEMWLCRVVEEIESEEESEDESSDDSETKG